MIFSESRMATEGYYIPQADVTVYSIEELAYVCAHKGYALDNAFAGKKLVSWVLEQCGCEELAFRLQSVLRQKTEQTDFVANILRFTGTYSESQIARVLQDISEGLGLSGYERKKREADELFRAHKYVQAVEAYENLTEILPEAETTLRAACYFNMAAAMCQLFLFEQALDALELSYGLQPAEDTLMAWLAAARMLYPEKQYLEMVGGREDLHDLSLALEERIKAIETEIIATKEGQELEKLREWMQYGGEDGYYVASGRLLKNLCQQYGAYYD